MGLPQQWILHTSFNFNSTFSFNTFKISFFILPYSNFDYQLSIIYHVALYGLGVISVFLNAHCSFDYNNFIIICSFGLTLLPLLVEVKEFEINVLLQELKDAWADNEFPLHYVLSSSCYHFAASVYQSKQFWKKILEINL